jgi:hypothetical protein
MKLARLSMASCLVLFSAIPISASESAIDCRTAVNTLEAGLEGNPDESLPLFLDALRTNPGCRRSLFIAAIEHANGEPHQIEQFIFIARREFPSEDTTFAEAALSAAPDHLDVIRLAFLAGEDLMSSALEEAEGSKAESLVQLPAEAQKLDEDIREAIARMTAKVEGKLWPEQKTSMEPVTFKNRDDLRIPRESRGADESSLRNGDPIDTTDERKISEPGLRINDQWEPEDRLRLDESKFASADEQDEAKLKEARKREIASAGAVGFPKRPVLRQSSVYYISPEAGDFRSTIDLNDQERPRLVIRPAQAFRSIPPDPKLDQPGSVRR